MLCTDGLRRPDREAVSVADFFPRAGRELLDGNKFTCKANKRLDSPAPQSFRPNLRP